MTVGVGVSGIYTGLVASWFLGSARDEQNELAEIRGQLDALTRAVESLRVRG
jgi:hypothetical protein